MTRAEIEARGPEPEVENGNDGEEAGEEDLGELEGIKNR